MEPLHVDAVPRRTEHGDRGMRRVDVDHPDADALGPWPTLRRRCAATCSRTWVECRPGRQLAAADRSLQPGQARRLQEQVLTKQELRQRIFDASTRPVDDVRDWQLFHDHPGMPDIEWNGIVQPCTDAADIEVVVTGGNYPGHAAVIPGWPWNKAVTKAITTGPFGSAL